MKRNSIFLSISVAILLILAQISTTAQTTIASWTFPTQFATPNTPTSFSAETGVGTIFLNGLNGASTWDQTTELNMNTGVSSFDLALIGTSSNGKSVVFGISMSNLQNLVMTCNIRRTASGHNVHDWAYSTDGTNYTTVTGLNSVPTAATTYEAKTLDFSSITAINNQATVYIKLTLNGAASTTGNNRFDDIVFTATSSSTNTVATPILSFPTSVIYTPTNVSITCSTVGASIYYTTDGTVPTQTSTLYTTPIAVTSNMTLKAKAFLTGYTESLVATATYTFPIEVATIAAFKAANTATNATVYKITGDVTFVYRNGRNIFVKDATAGLCIYDNTTSVITQTYNNGDVISGGVYGTCTLYGGLYEFIPTYATATGTSGSAVTPLVITADALSTNFSQYESQLVKIEDVTFATGTFGTGAAGNVNMTQGTTTLVCRNQFGVLTGYTTDATQPYDVIGFAIPYNTSKQVAPRALTDITPSYSIPTYIVTFPTVTGVTFTPETGFVSPVDSLGNFSFTVTLTPAYSNSVITVKSNGITLTPIAGVYTISTIESNQVVTIEGVLINSYTITATSGSNGSINPSGIVNVNYGSNQSFTITPNSNYLINTINVDGIIVTNVPTYTFTNITANHTIEVTFEQIPVNQFQITATAGANGSITPNGIVNVISGNDQAYTITPLLGYHIDSVFVDDIYNATATSTGAYTFTNVISNHTIRAVFAVNTYTITATAGANGSVFPSGVTTYNYSSNASFTATPANGYQIDSMFIDGVFTTPIATYLFQNITANHTIHYTFSLIPVPNFFEDFETLSAGTGSYSGANLTFASGIYYVKGYTTMDAASDRFNGTRSIRMRGNASDPNGNEITMTFDRPNGIGTVNFKYGSYGTHSGGSFVLQYSVDQGASWNDVPSNSFTAPAWSVSSSMETGNVVFNVPGAARIRFFKAMQGSGTSVNIDDIEMTDYTAVNTVATPTFSQPSGTIFIPINVTISCTTADAVIRYTTDGTIPTETSTIFTNPIAVSATTTIKAKAFKTGMTSSFVASAVYTFPIQVNTIEEFIDATAGVTSNTPYRISGDVTFVFRSGRYIYIKDNTASLLVFDNSTSVITNTYNNGDVISGGITGTYNFYNGLNQFIPIINFPTSTSNVGAITPIVVTAQEIAENYGLYESKLVTIQDVTFSAGEFNTTTTTNVSFTQGANTMVARNVHKTLSMTIPAGYNANITGFVLQFNTTFQIAPRENADIVEIVPEQVATPIFDTPIGTYTAPLIVVIHCSTPDAIIYYTSDGSNPTDQSQLYSDFIILEAGQYTMKAIAYKAGMTPSEVATVDYLVTVGVEDYLAHKIQIYPNPATQNVTINTTSDGIQITGYQIFDQFGKLMIQSNETLENNQINISNFANGMYVIRLLTNEGAINKKLMKL